MQTEGGEGVKNGFNVCWMGMTERVAVLQTGTEESEGGGGVQVGREKQNHFSMFSWPCQLDIQREMS